MQEMLWDFRYIIVVVLGIVVWALLDWRGFKTAVLQVMLNAKSLAKDLVLHSGQDQEDWVVDQLMLILPRRVIAIINIFGGKESLRKIVQWIYKQAKEKLEPAVKKGQSPS